LHIKRKFRQIKFEIKYHGRIFYRKVLDKFKPLFGMLTDDQKEIAHSMGRVLRNPKTTERITEKMELEKIYKKRLPYWKNLMNLKLGDDDVQ
jgi:hypothetical protein